MIKNPALCPTTKSTIKINFMCSIFYSVYSESVLTAEYLFLYGIKVTEQLDVLGPYMNYAENDGKQ